MIIYRYATLFREPGPGAVLREGLIQIGYTKEVTPSGHSAWGWAEYDRALTEKEIRDYELEYVHKTQIEEGMFC